MMSLWKWIRRQLERLFFHLHPKPKPKLDCRTAGIPESPFEELAPIDKVVGGIVTGKAIIVAGIPNPLHRSLTLVSENDLIINGAITAPTQTTPGAQPINITLISLKGDVKIANGAKIDGGRSAPGYEERMSSDPGFAVGERGENGGFIKIAAKKSILIDGAIAGSWGGNGGAAILTGQRPQQPMLLLFNLLIFVWRYVWWAGNKSQLTALGGPGGFGGDVVFCAGESIQVGRTGSVKGSRGGNGGDSTVTADDNTPAVAQGGDAGDNGDVILIGTQAGVIVDVNVGGVIEGAKNFGGVRLKDGGLGSVLRANFGKAPADGGSGYARGGDGSNGGTVRFLNCLVSNDGTIAAGDAGSGNSARASGGTARMPNPNNLNTGYSGGIAEAEGGDGGVAGTTPAAPNAILGQFGGGGDADAVPGTGGNGRVKGGQSGFARAKGGDNGVGQETAEVSTPRKISNNPPGAVGQPAHSGGHP
jgi:hypothetical protein